MSQQEKQEPDIGMGDDDFDSLLEEALQEEEQAEDDQQEDDNEFDELLEELEETEEEEQDSEVSTTGTVDYSPEIYFHSSENMEELEDESVHLIVTSPPYNADWAYGSHDDSMDYDTEYLPMLARVFQECYRVLVPGGRMVVNVPTLLRGGTAGGQSIISDIDTLLNQRSGPWTPRSIAVDGNRIQNSNPQQEWQTDLMDCMIETDFVARELIAWNKGFNDDGLAPNGSFPRPWGILLNNMHEGAEVYQKRGERDVSDIPDPVVEESKINKWSDDLCDDVWDISPVQHDFNWAEGEDVPPFPEEFVKRCIALWTYKGDTVLDPFLGRGTTCKVAKNLKRESVGYELREELKEDIESYVGVNQSTLF